MVSISDLKDVYEILKKSGNLEAQRKILELEQRHIEAGGEIRRLREQISRLEQQAALRAKIFYEGPYYWVGQGETRQGPYCQHCYDVKEKLIRLQACPNPGAWYCQACQNSVHDANYREPPPMDYSGVARMFGR